MTGRAAVSRGKRMVRAGLALAASAVLLALMWHSLPAGGPPLYDGVCVADPYAYLNPPPGAPRVTPGSASHAVPVSGGTVEGTELNTDELPPQAALTTASGSIVPPPGATSVTLSIRAVPPPSVLPASGHPDGNFYRFSALGNNGAAATTDPAQPVTVELRPTVAGSVETIQWLDGGHWMALPTSLGAGCAISLIADTASLGTFVLVAPGPASTGAGGSGNTLPAWLVGAAAVLGAAGVALVVLALRPSGAGPEPPSRWPRRPRPRR